MADVCEVGSSHRCSAEGRDEMDVAGDGHKLGSQLFVDEKAVDGRAWGICKHWHHLRLGNTSGAALPSWPAGGFHQLLCRWPEHLDRLKGCCGVQITEECTCRCGYLMDSHH